ncbi:MAG TPA: metallophosphoesterase family protein [Verrucomicrobiae bacterium]|nr:metallophosphoesterase family protein [Verrucomicrobiae bacterium]
MNQHLRSHNRQTRTARWHRAFGVKDVKLVLFLCAGLAALQWCAGQSLVVVPTGSPWRYLDTGVSPLSDWTTVAFDDSSWPEGLAQLGYGDNDEQTVLGFGPDPQNRYVTAWFRKTFNLTNAVTFDQLALRVLCDDGVVVSLNGAEIFRYNLPAGPITPTTLAVTNLVGDAEKTFLFATLPGRSLLDGINVLAAEVHQAAVNSVDLSFDLEMVLTNAAPIIRGPYLQLGLTNGATIRWRTALPSSSRVWCGPEPHRLDLIFGEPESVTNHIVQVTGLKADTLYYYAVGSGETEAHHPDYRFITAPMGAKPTRIWAFGDAGVGGGSQSAVRDAYYAFTSNRWTDVWLMLGDNAYGGGSDVEYQLAVFDIYPELLRKAFLWPTLGNHDYYSSYSDGAAGLPFLEIFSLPANGEAGGVASGTEKYYSFDFGNIHFVCLDSMSDRSKNGPMCFWLREDLANQQAEWVIAYWHHPPYSAGSHNSDVEIELIEMRQNVVPILETYGVDLVLSGHSHSYERSYLLHGHYDHSGTFDSAMVLGQGDGQEDGDGAYRKHANATAGTVYAVAGTGGAAPGGGTLNHPAMFVSMNANGSLVVDVDGPRLDAWFVSQTGAINDHFTILKSPPPEPRLTSVTIREGLLSLDWTSVPGEFYVVQRSSDIASAAWALASQPLRATATTSRWSEPWQHVPGFAFYRIALLTEP